MRRAFRPAQTRGSKRATAEMDRVEQAFVATAITGFLVMVGAIIWMTLS